MTLQVLEEHGTFLARPRFSHDPALVKRLTLAGVMGAEELAPFGEMLSGLVMAGERLSKAESGLGRALARAVECILRARGEREAQGTRAGEMDDDALRRLADHHREPDVRRMPKIH